MGTSSGNHITFGFCNDSLNSMKLIHSGKTQIRRKIKDFVKIHVKGQLHIISVAELPTSAILWEYSLRTMFGNLIQVKLVVMKKCNL